MYYGRRAWTGNHEAWLRRIHFELHGTRAAYEADLEAVEFAVARRARLDDEIAAMAADSEFTTTVHKLCCYEVSRR